MPCKSIDEEHVERFMSIKHVSYYSKSICVYCGSRAGLDECYVQAATELGRLIAKAQWRLVYGGGGSGLMGTVANSVRHSGGATLGVIPEDIPEQANYDLDCLILTRNMHERKSVMMANSDAFVALPGGFGTLEELFEVVVWRQLAIHSKPVYVLNVNGYWDQLATLIDSVVMNGFADTHSSDLLSFSTSPADLMTRLRVNLGHRI